MDCKELFPCWTHKILIKYSPLLLLLPSLERYVSFQACLCSRNPANFSLDGQYVPLHVTTPRIGLLEDMVYKVRELTTHIAGAVECRLSYV